MDNLILDQETKPQEKLMKDIFDEMDKYGHEQVIFCRHPGVGLKAIIAIHNTTLGPALGGCRMLPYNSTDEALEDVLKLSQGMTYKCGVIDSEYGGGKLVIIGDSQKDKSPDLFRVVGRFLEGLSGRYFTGPDMGTNPDDFVYAAKESKNIIGLPIEYGGAGNTSIPTGLGVFHAMRATCKYLFDNDSLNGKVVAVQGVGSVGEELIKLLLENKAEVIVSDISEDRLNLITTKYPVKMEDINSIHKVNCDIFSPCARGGILNNKTIYELNCSAIVGAANNQLAASDIADSLKNLNILYAPDYLVNSGGTIQVVDEIEGYRKERVLKKTELIYDLLLGVFEISKEENISTSSAADTMVRRKIEKCSDIRRILLGFDSIRR